MSESDLTDDRFNSLEANYWWRQNTLVGGLLNKLMLLFIMVPILLVMQKGLYGLSFIVFALMIPYGLLVRLLAVRAARHHLQIHPEDREVFEQAGIISR